MTPFIGDITGVNGFFVGAEGTDVGEGLRYGHLGLQIHKFGGQHTAGGVIGVLEQLVDHRTVSRACDFQHPLDHTGR